MHENQYQWVGLEEAALFISEFSNESLRDRDESLQDGMGENLCFAEIQRCFLPSESKELRALLSQRECSNKQAFMPLEVEEKIAALIAKEIEFL